MNGLKENKSFCLAPWLSIHTWPDGKTFPCCIWNSNDPVGNVNDSTLKEIWNNDRMKSTRVAMLNDEKITACKRCYDLEENGDVTQFLLQILSFGGVPFTETDLVENFSLGFCRVDGIHIF